MPLDLQYALKSGAPDVLNITLGGLLGAIKAVSIAHGCRAPFHMLIVDVPPYRNLLA